MLLWIILGLGFLTIIIANFLGVDKEKAELFIDQYQFPEALKQKLQLNYPDLNNEEVNLVFEGLRDFFQLHVTYPSMAFNMPSKIVDEAWHQMILFTKTYQDFCKQAFGRFLHHTPAVDKSPEENKDLLKNTWIGACKRNHLNPTTGVEFPLLFEIDRRLNIKGGLLYTRHNIPTVGDLQADRFPDSNCSSDGCSSCESGGDCGSD